jgi:hypothetical protein
VAVAAVLKLLLWVAVMAALAVEAQDYLGVVQELLVTQGQ